MPADDFYGPLTYDARWLWIAVALVVLAVAALAWALWPRRTAAPAVSTPAPARDVERLRRTALQEIARIEGESAAGRLAVRDAHQRLSRVVREFVARASGLPVDRMTLAELEDAALAPVATGVGQLYPGEFGIADQPLAAAVASARTAVSSWR